MGEEVQHRQVYLPAACQMCEYPVPQADIVFKLYGYAADQEIGIEVGEKLEKEIEEKGILSLSGQDSSTRTRVIGGWLTRGRRSGIRFRNSRGWSRIFLTTESFAACIRCLMHGGCPSAARCVFRTIFERRGLLRWPIEKVESGCRPIRSSFT
jgi:hypothetical protein